MIEKSKEFKKEETILSKKLEQLENISSALLSTAFAMSNLTDELVAFNKQEGIDR